MIAAPITSLVALELIDAGLTPTAAEATAARLVELFAIAPRAAALTEPDFTCSDFPRCGCPHVYECCKAPTFKPGVWP